jgi:TolA-binding protein
MRWISCHLVLLFVVGFVIWGYAWRTPLLGTGSDHGAPPAEPRPSVAAQPPAPVAQFRPPEVADQAGPPEPEALDAASLLQSARRAYWNGDLEAAERQYRRYVTHYPDDPAGYGELGNLFEGMGRDAEAQEAFRQAASRLRAAGEAQSAALLLRRLGEAPDDPAAPAVEPGAKGLLR